MFNESDITDRGAAKRMGPPVAGVFKINGDKIATWRDYFDLAMAIKQ